MFKNPEIVISSTIEKENLQTEENCKSCKERSQKPEARRVFIMPAGKLAVARRIEMDRSAPGKKNNNKPKGKKQKKGNFLGFIRGLMR